MTDDKPAVPTPDESGDETSTAPDAGATSELQRFWEAVKRLPAYVRLGTRLARDPRVPVKVKAILGAGGGYAISPVDLVPGVIPVAGQMDDMYVLLMALQQALKRVPDDVADEHLAAVGLERSILDDDLAAVRDLVAAAVVNTARMGGRALGRFSRATIRFANSWYEERRGAKH